MCRLRTNNVFVTVIWTLLTLQFHVSGNNEEAVGTHDGDNDLLARVVGVPGVWWPVSHLVSSAWSLLAAGLSSAVVGASFLPQLRRSDQVSERIYRGVVAKPHSWPWIAKLKVRMSLWQNQHIGSSR